MPIKIKKAFIKQYTGKKVPKEWQSKYGKVYDKEEAEEIFYAWENKYKGGRK
jgi:HEPN domain-containing protein